MNIYISGISGTGMGPLALMAKAAGFNVCGSDKVAGAILPELEKAGIEVSIGEQDGEFLKSKLSDLDWFCYTSALPENHPELVLAKEAGVKCTKRDDLTSFLVEKLGLKMVAIAGTHGKTTTHPWLSVITTVSYDHPDIYPTKEEYSSAFEQFKSQSEMIIEEPDISLENFKLAGEARRYDAALSYEAVRKMAPDVDGTRIVEILNDFPGVGRRFERLAEGIYTDYGHHPEEISATIDVAVDEAKMRGYKGVVVVYQPHQNVRQHEVRDGYKEAFLKADKVLWLPTYLVREDPNLPILTPEELIVGINGAEAVELSDELFSKMIELRDEGYLVMLMTAGPADEWLRKKIKQIVF